MAILVLRDEAPTYQTRDKVAIVVSSSVIHAYQNPYATENFIYSPHPRLPVLLIFTVHGVSVQCLHAVVVGKCIAMLWGIERCFVILVSSLCDGAT